MIDVFLKNEFQVSVIIATYNPDWIKLKRTLLSVLLQKKLSFEIVVVDDGSRENFREDIELLFQQYKFDTYKIIDNPQNQGTVMNVLSGVKVAVGKYIKLISPGDLLYSDRTLYEFAEFMEKTMSKISFGRAIYYNFDEHSKLNVIRHHSNPSAPSMYKLGTSINTEKFHYLVKDDLVLGAATLVERCLLNKYLELISGKVIYAEDNCYRLMIADGNRISFFENIIIFYEYGYGVSTNGKSEWAERLKNDWKATDKLICTRLNTDYIFNKKLKLYFEANNNKKKRWLKRLLFIPYYLKIEKKEYTVCNSDLSFFNKIVGE